MKKRVRKVAGVIFLALALAVSQVPPSFAEAIATAGEFHKDGNTLISYTGTASVVSVPSDIKKIATDAFAGNYYLEEVKIPSGVEVIENGAFRDCKRLKKVYLSEGLEKIESGAFSMCPKLSYVKFSSTIMDLGAGVFAGDKNLSKIDMGNNSYFVFEDGALYNRDQSKLIQVFSGRIGTFFDIPDTVMNIERYAFWGCNNLEEIELSSNLYEIPEYSFSNCSKLEDISFPHSVRKISAKAFEDCICLKNIILPVSVTEIHPTAFDGCYDLKISAQEGTAAYEFAKAFEETKLLLLEQEGIVISQNSIGNIYSNVEEEVETSQDEEEERTKEKPDVYDPSNPSDVSKLNVSDYYATDSEDLLGKTRVVNGNAVVLYEEKQEPAFRDDIKETEFVPDLIAGDNGNHVIGKKEYYQATDIKKATMEPTVRWIDDFAFARSSLTDVVIPEGVTHIGYGAFYHCDKLSHVEIPASVETIEPEAFSKTPYLENWKQQPGEDFLIVGDGILLAYKGNAARVYIPENVKKIAPGAFANHPEILEVTFGNLLEEIGEDAFNGCASLNMVHWGSGVQKIADRAFALCPLAKTSIPYSVSQIGLGAFKKVADGGVVFENQDVLPAISYEKTATRIENASMRELAFPDSSVAVIKDADIKIKDSVLDVNNLGFRGIVLEIKDFNATQAKLVYATKLPDSATGLVEIPKTVRVNGKSYDITSALPDALDAYETYDIWGETKLKGILLPPSLGKVEDYHSQLVFENDISNEENSDESPTTQKQDAKETLQTEYTGVTTIVRESEYSDAKDIIAEVLDDESDYLLYVDRDPISQTALLAATEQEYGPLLQGQLNVLDLTMVERKSNVPITNFGNSLVEIWLPISETLASQNICVLTLNESGKISTIYGTKQRKNDKNYFVFRTKHFSPYGLYAGIGEHGEKIKMESQKLLQKDVSPQTGDFSFSKWIIVALSLLLGIALSIGIPLRSAK